MQALCETEVVVERVVERLRLPSCRKTDRATAAAARPKQAPGLCVPLPPIQVEILAALISTGLLYIIILRSLAYPLTLIGLSLITQYDTKYVIQRVIQVP